MNKTRSDKYRRIIYTCMFISIVLWVWEVESVVYYYSNYSRYTEYEGTIHHFFVDIEGNSRRSNSIKYYCQVEYSDEDGNPCTIELYRQLGDAEGDEITFYMLNKDTVYRKGHIMNMNRLSWKVLCGICMILSIYSLFIKDQNKNAESTDNSGENTET